MGRGLAIAQSKAVRWGFGLVAVALAAWAAVSRRTEVLDALGRLDPDWLLLAAVATLGNTASAGLMWKRLLADLGSQLPWLVAARVFFLGQLGKYVPGSVWPLVMQAELASDHGVARRRTAAATVISLLLSVAIALAVVAGALPFVPEVVPSGFGWAVFLVLPLLVLLHPAILDRLINAGLTALGRDPLERRTSLRGTAVATGWALSSWVAAGLQVWALSASLGGPATLRGLLLAIGGYALAWSVGFVVVVAPAGAGAREVALAAVLSTVLDRGAVVVVVLLSRVLFTASDLTLAGAAIALGRSRRRAPVA
ncbi:MAG TPA: lysylphosphatidylglycerol synthase domain-containing protein [Kineosporiaceae bacterium]|nr:lysylphosphatidylglycerol synthase domain-containing protein [Kineosporiaceae bacterium]